MRTGRRKRKKSWKERIEESRRAGKPPHVPVAEGNRRAPEPIGTEDVAQPQDGLRDPGPETDRQILAQQAAAAEGGYSDSVEASEDDPALPLDEESTS